MLWNLLTWRFGRQNCREEFGTYEDQVSALGYAAKTLWKVGFVMKLSLYKNGVWDG